MVMSFDFTSDLERIVHFTEGDLVALVPNKRYQTPDGFWPDSLIVTVNKTVLDQVNDNGYDIVADDVFELKIPKLSHHFLQGYYFRR